MRKLRSNSELDLTGRIIQLIMVIGNCVFGILGCIVVAVGIYLAVDKLQFVTIVFGTHLVPSASYAIIAAACVVVFISFIGCFGSLFEVRFLLILYSILVSAVFVLAIIGSCMCIVWRSWVSDQVRYHMRKTLQYEYGVDSAITSNWDMAQEKWYCCGVDDSGWAAYLSSEWHRKQPGTIGDGMKPYVPQSCCKKNQYGGYLNLQICQTFERGPPSKSAGLDNVYLFKKGCFSNGLDSLYKISGYLIGIGLAMAAIVVSGIVLSMVLVHRMQLNKEFPLMKSVKA